MAKRYKSKCTVEGHDEHELTSNVGEDLADFKARMQKGGHKVGELFNSDYKMTERGYKLFSELMTVVQELKGEFEEIKGVIDIQSTLKDPGTRKDIPPEVPPALPPEAVETDEGTAPP